MMMRAYSMIEGGDGSIYAKFWEMRIITGKNKVARKNEIIK